MKRARFLAPLVVLAALAAGCGGGGTAKLQPGDVAVVGNQHVPKTAFDALMAQAKLSYKQQGRSFPKQGSTQYESIKAQAVTLLVQQAERAEKAASLGIHITPKQIQQRLDQIKKQYFQGSEKQYQAQLKKQHLTDQQVRDEIKTQLISEQIINKITGQVTVSNKEIHQYYVAHKNLYSRPPSRDVRHILVKSKPLAYTLYGKLRSAPDSTWCKLAKKYSLDPGSKNNCGKLTVTKGQTVAAFDAVAFGAPTHVVHTPVHDPHYGWFVIEPLSAVKPVSTTPESQEAATIRQQLLQQKKNDALTKWAHDLQQHYCSDHHIKYQPGYQPSPDPCAAFTTTNTTTT
ncbi:MAG TPA: SurA N-terminal domain-containing protein [Gaiellaceae bacterium]|nr:SurA N-terminal domain-containing protein [Gaiellaceae bacterium]